MSLPVLTGTFDFHFDLPDFGSNLATPPSTTTSTGSACRAAGPWR
jgi:hypothetical protein